jgi:hypothetical protein
MGKIEVRRYLDASTIVKNNRHDACTNQLILPHFTDILTLPIADAPNPP